MPKMKSNVLQFNATLISFFKILLLLFFSINTSAQTFNASAAAAALEPGSSTVMVAYDNIAGIAPLEVRKGNNEYNCKCEVMLFLFPASGYSETVMQKIFTTSYGSNDIPEGTYNKVLTTKLYHEKEFVPWVNKRMMPAGVDEGFWKTARCIPGSIEGKYEDNMFSQLKCGDYYLLAVIYTYEWVKPSEFFRVFLGMSAQKITVQDNSIMRVRIPGVYRFGKTPFVWSCDKND